MQLYIPLVKVYYCYIVAVDFAKKISLKIKLSFYGILVYFWSLLDLSFELRICIGAFYLESSEWSFLNKQCWKIFELNDCITSIHIFNSSIWEFYWCINVFNLLLYYFAKIEKLYRWLSREYCCCFNRLMYLRHRIKTIYRNVNLWK